MESARWTWAATFGLIAAVLLVAPLFLVAGIWRSSAPAVGPLIMVFCGLAAVMAIAADARGKIPATAFGSGCFLLGLGLIQLRHELTQEWAEGATMISGVAVGLALGFYLCWWIVRRKPKLDPEPVARSFPE